MVVGGAVVGGAVVGGAVVGGAVVGGAVVGGAVVGGAVVGGAVVGGAVVGGAVVGGAVVGGAVVGGAEPTRPGVPPHFYCQPNLTCHGRWTHSLWITSACRKASAGAWRVADAAMATGGVG